MFFLFFFFVFFFFFFFLISTSFWPSAGEVHFNTGRRDTRWATSNISGAAFQPKLKTYFSQLLVFWAQSWNPGKTKCPVSARFLGADACALWGQLGQKSSCSPGSFVSNAGWFIEPDGGSCWVCLVSQLYCKGGRGSGTVSCGLVFETIENKEPLADFCSLRLVYLDVSLRDRRVVTLDSVAVAIGLQCSVLRC